MSKITDSFIEIHKAHNEHLGEEYWSFTTPNNESSVCCVKREYILKIKESHLIFFERVVAKKIVTTLEEAIDAFRDEFEWAKAFNNFRLMF